VQVDVIQKLFNEYGSKSEIQILQKNLVIDSKQAVLSITFYEDQLSKPGASNYIDSLKRRRSYREDFVKTLDKPKIDEKNTYIITDEKHLKDLTKTYNQCAAKQSLNKGYMDELRDWVKLSQGEVGFGTEGLDYISLNLNTMETLLAKLFLNDKWARCFSKLGLHGLLTNESSNFKNISGIAIKVMDVTSSSPASLIAEGREYITIWLSLVSQGYEVCPISTLIDLPEGHEQLRKILKLPNDALFSVAFRFGKGNGSSVRRVRRPLQEWLFNTLG